MAKKIKISELPIASSLNDLWIFGKGAGKTNVRASMSLLRGNTAFVEWQGRNPGKTYEDWIKLLQDPAFTAAEGIDLIKKNLTEFGETAKSAESGRVKAEGLRIDAEKVRAQAETKRVNAETARAEAEKTREASEITRGLSEDARIVEEGLRKKSEASRAESELVRIAQEEARETGTAEAVLKAEAATAISLQLNDNPPKPISGTWWVWSLSEERYVNTTIPSQGAAGKPLVVLENGNYGNWNEETQSYDDSGVEASTTVDIESANVDFLIAEKRENIESGEKITDLFGKIARWLIDIQDGVFSKLKGLAYKDKVDWATDVDNKPKIPSLTSDLNNDSDYQSSLQVSKLLNDQLSSHNSDVSAHNDIRSELSKVRNIAEGATVAKVFDTEKQMLDWLSVSGNTSTLKPGYHLYIKELNVPDYWWDGSDVQILETGKVDLSEYATTEESDLRYLGKNAQASDSAKFGGVAPEFYLKKIDAEGAYLGKDAQAVDSAMLGGVNADLFLQIDDANANYLGKSEKATDSEKLGGIAASEFAKKGLHKSATLQPSAFSEVNGFFQAKISDADIVDGVTIDSGCDIASLDIWSGAGGLTVSFDTEAGFFNVICRNKPTDSLNIKYTIR